MNFSFSNYLLNLFLGPKFDYSFKQNKENILHYSMDSLIIQKETENLQSLKSSVSQKKMSL